MDDIVLIILGVVVLLLLMFIVFKFLMREQSYDTILEHKKQELENAAAEQKPGKQKRKHVYSKHSDKSKLVDDKQKLTDDNQLADDKQKSAVAKERSPDHKQNLADDKRKAADVKEKSPGHKQKFQEEKTSKSDVTPSVSKSGFSSKVDASCRATPTHSPSKKHVEIESKVETIDPDVLSQRPATPEPSLSSHPSRSILVNKDEKSLVTEAESVPETFHPRPGPVDELDKKHQEEGRRLSGTILVGDVEVLREKTESRSTPSPPADKSNQKKKKKGKAVEIRSEQDGKAISFNVEQDPLTKTQDVARRDPKDAVGVTVKMLEDGDIEEKDCKTLVKALESRGFNVVSSSKKKKDEDCSAEALKKIRDLESSLQKEKLTMTSSEAQVKQLQDQIALEKQKSENLKKGQQSQIAKQLQEINDLRSSLELTLKAHERERLQLQTRLDSVQLEVDERSRVVQALMEENGKLKTTAGTSLRNEVKLKVNPLQAPCDDNTDASLEDNIKQFEDKFEEMVAKQEMEKMKEDNETLVHSLRSQIAELNAEILEKDCKIDLLQLHDGNVKFVNDAVVCEKISLTGHQAIGSAPPSSASAQDGIFANGIEQNSIDENAFHDKKVRDMEELLQKQKQKNDELRRKNWKVMEALTELENELQKSTRAKGTSGTSENTELERLKKDQEKLIISLQHQIADLQKQSDHKEQKKTIGRGLGHGADHETEIMKLEDSLNRQIQKNDDLRRRNWKTMEALSEMEKRLQNRQLGSEHESSEVDHLKDELRSLQKDKLDLEILNKGLSSNLATCVHQVEQAEKCSSDALSQLKNVTSENITLKTTETSTDGLNDLQVTRIAQLETFMTEKNIRIKQLEEELLAAQDLKGEKAKMLESVHHMRQALKEKDVAIHSLQAQLKNSAASQRSVSTEQAEQNSYSEVLLKKESEINELKSELSLYQTQIKEFENRDRLLRSLKPSGDSSGELTVAEIKASGSDHERTFAEQKSLEDQVKHYQDVLADTAGMLNKLQLSVEKEESKWLRKVAEAEEKTDEALQEAKQLRDELEALRKSS